MSLYELVTRVNCSGLALTCLTCMIFMIACHCELEILNTVKPGFFACPLFCEFREPGKFAKIMGRENLNTVAFQCSGKQKR